MSKYICPMSKIEKRLYDKINYILKKYNSDGKLYKSNSLKSGEENGRFFIAYKHDITSVYKKNVNLQEYLQYIEEVEKEYIKSLTKY